MARQRPDGVGEIFRPRHRRTFDEYRYHQNIRACQRRRYLQPKVVVLLIESPAPGGIRGVQPLPADQREQGAAFTKARIDCVHEVLAGADGVDIPEDLLATQPSLERLTKPACVAG